MNNRTTSEAAQLAGELAGVLSDGIAEAMLRPRDATGRSEMICHLVQEIYEVMAWLKGSRAHTDPEVASLHQLLTEADAHRQRMASAAQPLDELRAS